MDPLLAQALGGTPNTDILNATMFNISGSAWNSASAVYYNYLNPLATGVAKGILPLALTVEIILCGFRIMMGKTIVEQAVKILLASFICFVLVFRQYPQRILAGALIDLQEAGRAVSGTMMHEQLVKVFAFETSPPLKSLDPDKFIKAHTLPPHADRDLTPMLAWAAWVDPDNDSTSDNYKYGFKYLRDTIFANPWNDWALSNTLYEKEAYGNLQKNQDALLTPGFFDRLWNLTGGSLDEFIGGHESTAINAGSMLYIMSPMTAFSYAVPIAMSIMAGMVAPMWVSASVLAATYYSFFIVMALGTAVVPLLYFASFADIWKSWLKFLVGVALIPMLYYIFSAIGFIFATSTYDVLFPAHPGPGNFGMSAIYGSVLQQSIVLAYNSNVSGNVGSLTNFANFIEHSMKLFFRVAMLLGRQGSGCAIITAFILAGTAFPLAAVKLAMKWSTGFDENAVFEGVMQAFQTIQGGIGTAIGQQYTTGMEVASQVVGKLSSMAIWGGIGGLFGGVTGAKIGAAFGFLRK